MPADWAGAPHARTLREQLRYWPYTIHQVDETLDVSMIEGRARQILFQGLNAQSITAFVGSGLSASYGRLSWPGWKREQLAVVEQNYQAFIQLAQAALAVKVMLIEATAPLKVPEKTSGIKQGSARRLVYDAVDDDDKDFGQKHRYNCQQWFKYRKRQIENALDQVQHLYATYSRVMAEGNDGFPGGDGLPVIFEIAQQLQDELRRYVPFFIPEKALTSGEKLEPKETKTWPGSLFENLSAAPNESLKALEKIVFPDGRELLIEAFKNMTAKSGEFVPAGETEGYLGVIKVYIGHLKRYYDVYGQPEAAFDFETLAKLLLVDECAHALITLREGYKSGSEFKGDVAGDRNLAELERHLKVFDPSVLKRNVDGIRDNPDRYKILTPYLLQHFVKQEEKDMSLLELEKLSEDHSDLSPLIKTIQKELAGHLEQARGQQLFLTPSSRFLLATVLALHEKEKRAELVIDANEPGKDRGSLFYPEVRNKDFTSRRSIIANRLDPLAKVVEDLGVRRFITLNYDFEIERYFIDEGFRHFPPSSVRARETKEPENEDYRVDGVGRVLYDQTFERETASNMVRFSVGQNKERAAVFHLHGRATDEDALVITERDYMELYLLEDEQRKTVHEGITMAFSSAPLLFMGLGMSEADLLRPLRQFMSNEDRTSGYSSVALLPAEYPLADRTKFSAALYLRYGVHTIFYGGGIVSVGEEDAQGEKASVNIDWLCTILSIIGSLRKVVSGARKEPAEMPTQLEIATLVIEGCGELGKDKVDHQDKSALLALLGELFPLFEDGKTENAAAKFLNLIKTKPLQDAVFTSVRKSEANRMSPHHDSLSDIDGHLFTSFYTSILTDVLRVMTGGLSVAIRREALQKGGKLKQDGDLSRQLAALEIALNGLHGAFLTSTLNAALAGLEKQWKSWWDKWQDAPPLRLAKFEDLDVPKNAPGLQRYVRHPIENVISPLDDEPPKVPLMRRQAGGGLQVESSWRTGIRAFDTFIEAVAVHRRTAPPTSQHAVAGQRAGRLMFTIAAHRGLGKGTLQSAFVSTRGLLAYQAAAWPVQDERRRSVWISGAAFINFSFATEIASCYDMLAEVLIDQLVRHDKTLAVEQADRRAVLEARYQGVSRLVMLRTLFDAFRDYSARSAPGPHQPRLLIALSALDLLYDDGVCKNEEIRVVLELLTGPDLEDHPIDLIALASEGGGGLAYWRSRVRASCNQCSD